MSARGDSWCAAASTFLAVALRENITLPLPQNATPLWQSEDYATEPNPPQVTDEEVSFSVPGAVLFSLNETGEVNA